MFGLFKEKMSRSAAAKIIVAETMQWPGPIHDRLTPFDLEKSQYYLAELYALVYAITALSVDQAALKAGEKQPLNGELARLLGDFLARQITGEPMPREESTGLAKFFESRYGEYCNDSSDKEMAERFLRYVEQASPHQTVLLTTAASIYATRCSLVAEVKRLFKAKRLV